LKMREIFFWANYFMGHFKGYFEGAKTFLTPKLSRAQCTADFENAGDYFFAGKLIYGNFKGNFEGVKNVEAPSKYPCIFLINIKCVCGHKVILPYFM
jgi:hypothetical protein